MVNNMKERGFMLIELVIVVAIVGILLAIAFGAYRDHHSADEVEMPPTQILTEKELPPMYISNDRRSRETVTLQRHSDGSIWACIENSKCYEVR